MYARPVCTGPAVMEQWGDGIATNATAVFLVNSWGTIVELISIYKHFLDTEG